MKTTRLATTLTVFFALMCVFQFLQISTTLDNTRTQLSNRSTGAINTLMQVDKNLDFLLISLVSYKNNYLEGTDTSKAINQYQSAFDVLWASAKIFDLYTPGQKDKFPEMNSFLEEVSIFLQYYDPYMHADKPLSIADADRIYKETIQISNLLHELGIAYFVAQSDFSDELKKLSEHTNGAFYFFAIMLLCAGTFSAYSLMMANKRSNDLVRQSEETQQRLTQVVKELRSGKLENKAKDSFIAAASHDLRQPLHALGLFLGALERHVQPTGHAIMEKAQQSSAALTRLLSSLLDLSRLDAGVVKVSQKDFSLSGLLKTLETEFQETAAEYKMKLVFENTDAIVRTDRILLDRILRNLIENALTHSKGTEVKIKCNKVKDKLCFTISDNGRGIPNNEKNNIFSEYYQIGNPERDRSKGLGIGLSIVNRLSELLDLQMHFESHLNSGCTFILLIPLGTPVSLVQTKAPLKKSNSYIDTGLIIGVIDDDHEIREGMEIMLNNMNYHTFTADSANAMIDVFKKEEITPDLLIADYRLRENHTGDAAIEKICAALKTRVPAIIITGDTSPDRVIGATLSGYKLMHKPVEPNQLLSAIDNLLQNNHALAARDSGANR